MPFELIHERYLSHKSKQSPFVQKAHIFQDLVIRCVRYAFANIPAHIGAVFFSRSVSLPFMRFRMLRHGYLRCPVHFEEISRPGLKGVWIIQDPDAEPDIAILYCHGGGFSMGSSYFYLEFLIAWCSLLYKDNGGRFRNPAIFALEYTLVPTKIYPSQLLEVKRGYQFIVEEVEDSDRSRICVAGDSAGATLILSLLLDIATNPTNNEIAGIATLISPWCMLFSKMNQNTKSDYLNADSLHLYACQYVGAEHTLLRGTTEKGAEDSTALYDPIASPGCCQNAALWKQASPRGGFHIVCGAEEVFAPSARALSATLQEAGTSVVMTDRTAGIHAWPIVDLFLRSTTKDRLAGLYDIVAVIEQRMLVDHL